MRIVIIGAGPAGVSSAIASRQMDPNAEIHVFTDETIIGCSRSYLPFLFSNIPIDKPISDGVSLFDEHSIKVHLQTRISEINAKEKKVFFNGKQLEYDRLIICSGSGKPTEPSIRGIKMPHVVRLWDNEDFLKTKKLLAKSKNLLLIGFGFVGIEVAFLAAKGFRVTAIESLETIKSMEFLDEDFQAIFVNELRNHGISLKFGVQLKDVEITKESVKVGSEVVPADVVIVNMGDSVKDYLKFASDSKIELGSFNLLKINEKCETNVPGILAAGDCTEFVDFTNRPTYSAGELTAKLQGRIAGINAAGGNEKLKPIIIPGILAFDDFQLGWVGATNLSKAKAAGFEPVVADFEGFTKEESFPTSEKLRIRLYSDKTSGLIIGAEIFGKSGVEERVNILSLAIKLGAKVSDLKNYEIAYMPNVATLNEPIAHCAFKLPG
jgi:NADPH-dependent 2,4-dienoyl-CoA reductase/sulfur reductase-like enzyme